MLVLTRKPGQTIRIGNDIQIEILSVNGEHIKVGISAPSEVLILRDEIHRSVCRQNQSSVIPGPINLAGVRLKSMNEGERERDEELNGNK
ncbi:MAG: carbon storage regulator [Desulfitobacteriaceae bacterium]